MTEADWLTCNDPDTLLDYLENRASERKFRLFACACCRQVWPLLTFRSCREAVEMAEACADGQADEQQLAQVFRTAQEHKPLFADANWAGMWSAAPSGWQAAAEASLLAARAVARIAGEPTKSTARAAHYWGAPDEQKQAAWAAFESVIESAIAAQRRKQADLLREVIGNPLAAPPAAELWPAAVLALAESLYAGADCAFALHDALLEAGAAELAEHFRGPSHPRGCWALDFILGKN